MLLVPRCCFVIKRELLRIPLFGGMLRGSRMIAVDREAGASALRTLVKQGEEAAGPGRPRSSFFPEGTRADPGARLPLQPGVAALAGLTGIAGDPGRHQFWAVLGPARLPQAAGQYPYRDPGFSIPAGLPRAELMQRLKSALRESAEGAGAPVDKPVGLGLERSPDHGSLQRVNRQLFLAFLSQAWRLSGA